MRCSGSSVAKTAEVSVLGASPSLREVLFDTACSNWRRWESLRSHPTGMQPLSFSMGRLPGPEHGCPTLLFFSSSGRTLTKEGRRDLDRIAQQVLFPELFE